MPLQRGSGGNHGRRYDEQHQSQGKIAHVHFHDVQGVGDCFAECFIGEGNVGVTETMLTLKRLGFTRFLIDDHVRYLEGDIAWTPRAAATLPATSWACSEQRPT